MHLKKLYILLFFGSSISNVAGQDVLQYKYVCDSLIYYEQYNEAVSACALAMEIAWSEDTDDTLKINTAIQAGNAYYFNESYAEALNAYNIAYTFMDKTIQDTAWLFDILASVHNLAGTVNDNALQAAMAEKGIPMSIQVFGYPNEYLLSFYLTLNSWHSGMSDYNNAQKYLQEALRVHADMGLGEDEWYAELLLTQASDYFDVGKYAACDIASGEAARVFDLLPGKKANACSSYSMQATCRFSNGDYEASMQSALNGIAYFDSLERPDLMENAMTFATLIINIDLKFGTTIAEESGLLDALKTGIKYFDTVQYTSPYNLVNGAIGIGNYYIQKKAWDSVQLYYTTALEINNKYFGTNDILYLYIKSVLSSCALHLGNLETAKELYLEIADYTVQYLNAQFLYVSETEKEYLLNEYTSHHNNFIYFFRKYQEQFPELNSIVADTDIFLRGLLLRNITAFRNNVITYGTASDQLLFEQWLQKRQDAATAFTQNATLAAQLEREAEQLEKQLPDTLKTLIRTNNTASWKDLSGTLNPGEAFVQFMYAENNIETGELVKDYFALLTLPNATNPQYVYLFNDTSLAPILQKQNTETDRNYVQRLYGFPDPDFPDDTLYYQGNKLYTAMWKPLEKYLTNTNKIYYTTAGIYNQIALHAIPVDATSCIYNKYALVHKINLSNAPVTKNKMSSIFLAGGINYESAVSISDAEYFALALTDTSSDRGGTWKALPGTLTEIEKIESFAQENNTETKMLKGSEASEQAIKNADLKKYDVLHIATHGYFFPDTIVTDTTLPGIEFRSSTNPLIRSGIILAGGNNTWINSKPDSLSEDGILTAYEISNLNLLNTQLVVLSACETGLGDIKGTEGVYGLQRAFQMAGAKQLLVSLWKIPDQYTAEFMQVFYTTLFSGQNAENSLHTARLHMQKKTDAYNWAAFVLVQ